MLPFGTVYGIIYIDQEREQKQTKEVMKMNLQEKVRIAEEMILNSIKTQKEFLAMYKTTGKELYKELADNEQETREKLREAVTEAYLKIGR